MQTRQQPWAGSDGSVFLLTLLLCLLSTLLTRNSASTQLRNMVTSLSASKADGSNLLQHQQHCQQQLLELQRGLAGAQAAASEAAIAAAVAKTALEPVDALRLQLAETQGMVAALQATAAGTG